METKPHTHTIHVITQSLLCVVHVGKKPLFIRELKIWRKKLNYFSKDDFNIVILKCAFTLNVYFVICQNPLQTYREGVDGI